MVCWSTRSGAANLHMAWFERSGKLVATFGRPDLLGALNLSPDGKNVAVSIEESPSGNADIWIYDVTRGPRTRFTHWAANAKVAIWSPDGAFVVFSSNRKGHYDLYRKPANGAGNEELLYADDLEKRPTSWSPNGKFVLYSTIGDPNTKQDLWVLPTGGGAVDPGMRPSPFQQTTFDEYHGQFSPDGRWIVYQSNESGAFEIYAAPFDGAEAAPGRKFQISTGGGVQARWRPDGREVFYAAPDREVDGGRGQCNWRHTGCRRGAPVVRTADAWERVSLRCLARRAPFSRRRRWGGERGRAVNASAELESRFEEIVEEGFPISLASTERSGRSIALSEVGLLVLNGTVDPRARLPANPSADGAPRRPIWERALRRNIGSDRPGISAGEGPLALCSLRVATSRTK